MFLGRDGTDLRSALGAHAWDSFLAPRRSRSARCSRRLWVGSRLVARWPESWPSDQEAAEHLRLDGDRHRVYALLVPFLFRWIDHVYALIWQQLQPGFFAFSLWRFVLSGLMLLVPTTLMGATLAGACGGAGAHRREETQTR